MFHVCTAGRQLNLRHFYCKFNVVCLCSPVSHTASFPCIFLANIHTQSHSLSSEPSTPTPPIPRVQKREKFTIFEANVFFHALDSHFFVEWFVVVVYKRNTQISDQCGETVVRVSVTFWSIIVLYCHMRIQAYSWVCAHISGIWGIKNC